MNGNSWASKILAQPSFAVNSNNPAPDTYSSNVQLIASIIIFFGAGYLFSTEQLGCAKIALALPDPMIFVKIIGAGFIPILSQ